jgi:tetratricopeptide (TPR) repeat protein
MVGMTGSSADPAFDHKFREFLMQPDTQEVIAADQKKELDVMKKIDEMEKLEELQGQREQLAVAMQDLDPEAQRLIYPILRLKMVQHILFASLKESRKSGTSFVHTVRDPSLLRMLERVRDELNNDPENARRIEAEWFHSVRMGIEHKLKHAPKKERQVLPATQMLPIIQSGVQLRINGNHQFKQANYMRALEMYMQGCVGFELYCATNAQDQGMLDEVHVQVRKNTQAAALKTRDFTICIESCDKVLEMEPGDTKSLFRRALAHWRLGDCEKASEDLEQILRMRVADYDKVQDSAQSKRAARKLLRQIEASEERAEIIEARMAKALSRAGASAEEPPAPRHEAP